jgi:hypothetical protein
MKNPGSFTKNTNTIRPIVKLVSSAKRGDMKKLPWDSNPVITINRI